MSKAKKRGARWKERYWLGVIGGPYHQVSRQEFISAERSAGFTAKDGGGGLATGGFSHGNSSGKITYGRERP